MTRHPATIEDLQDAVRTHDALRIRGAGTKSPAWAEHERVATLDLQRLSGITEYSPDECVVTALAGTPVRDIDAVLHANAQYLPFDPPFASAGATIGGTVAAGLSGPGRYRYGGVRDFLIGARVVDGEGRLIRSGGKVVKNAAGFLLHHGLVGSCGRLGAIAEVTFKVFPRPETRATITAACGNLSEALSCSSSLRTQGFDLECMDIEYPGTLLVRLAGRASAMPERLRRLQVAIAHQSHVIDDEGDRALWHDAIEFTWVPSNTTLIKVPTTPATVASFDAWGRSVTHARFSCGASVAWIAWSGPVEALSSQLATSRLRGQIVRGPQAGTRIGLIEPNEFEERLRRVLDPRDCFRAASNSSR